jgi:hypothetical protein
MVSPIVPLLVIPLTSRRHSGPEQTSDALSNSKDTGNKRYQVTSGRRGSEIWLESRITRIFRPESLKSRTGNAQLQQETASHGNARCSELPGKPIIAHRGHLETQGNVRCQFFRPTGM